MRTSDSKKCNPCAREKMLPMYRELQKTPYPNGVVADRTRRSNNAYSVEKTGRHQPRVARFALQPWATRNNAVGVVPVSKDL